MIAGLLCLLSLTASPAGEPAPESARIAGLDAQLVINDVPTHVREWLIDHDLRESTIFYRRYLGEQHIELNTPRGLLLAAPREGRFVTVELSRVDDRRTRARLSEARMDQLESGSDPLPLPANTIVLSRMRERVGRRAVQTVLARSDSGVLELAQELRRNLDRAGLRLIDRQAVQGKGSRGEIWTFADARRRAEIVLTAERGMTWVAAVVVEGGP